MSDATMLDKDDRRHTRIQLAGELSVHEIDAPYDLAMANVSEGGFLVRGPLPYPIGAQRTFTFATRAPQWSVSLRAQAVYSHFRQATVGGGTEYMTGFAFVNPENRTVASRVDDLMARVAEILSEGEPVRVVAPFRR